MRDVWSTQQLVLWALMSSSLTTISLSAHRFSGQVLPWGYLSVFFFLFVCFLPEEDLSTVFNRLDLSKVGAGCRWPWGKSVQSRWIFIRNMENLGNWVRHAVQKHVRTQGALCSNYVFAFDAHWVLIGVSHAAPHFRQGCGFTPVLKMRKPRLGDT